MAEGFGGGGGGAATGAIPHEFVDARQYTDIAVNLTDTMYKGQYHGGKQAHPADVENVLTRAALAGVTRIIITGTDLEESRNQGGADYFELDGLRVSNLNSLVLIEGATQVFVILFTPLNEKFKFC